MANFFPRWTNWLPLKLMICGIVTVTALVGATWYYDTPKYTRVGYMPVQPVPFPHDLHVTQLGMDCRYCHNAVELAAHSNVPDTQVCMNCHTQIQKENPKLEPVRSSWTTGQPVPWVQIHRTPDYVYYNHSAHVNRGISCYSCHIEVVMLTVSCKPFIFRSNTFSSLHSFFAVVPPYYFRSKVIINFVVGYMLNKKICSCFGAGIVINSCVSVGFNL